MEYITEIIIAIISFLCGIGVCITFNFISKKSSTKITQTKNKVKGTMAGRDINIK